MKRLPIITTVVVALLLVPTVARGSSVVYTNLGPGGTFTPNSGYQVSGGFFGEFTVATEFFATADYFLESVTVPLVNAFSEFGLVTISLVEGSDPLSAAVLETFTLASVNGFPSQLYTLLSVTHPLLSSGGQYWVVASATGNTLVIWSPNVTGAGEPEVSTHIYLGGTLINEPFDQPALEVVGEAATGVPEPTSLLLLGTGIVAAVRTRRFKYRRLP